jgi:hypothetical protein
MEGRGPGEKPQSYKTHRGVRYLFFAGERKNLVVRFVNWGNANLKNR